MTIENLYPFAGAHAVQNATFVIEWPDLLPESVIVEANKLGTKFKNVGLDHHLLQHQVELKLSNAPDAQHSQKSFIGGILFSTSQEVTPTARSVLLSRNGCIVSIPDYTRWAAALKDVEKYLKIVLDEIGPLRPISVIGLQYTDTFSWKDDPAELNLEEVFSSDHFVPKNILQQKNLWHLHQGYFQKHSTPVSHVLLENINLETHDNNGLRVIQITGSHRATLENLMWQSHMKNKDNLFSMFSALHQANKTMLSKLLMPEVRNRINLDAK
jgi:uncharacterized protein (TIGR04255 family)